MAHQGKYFPVSVLFFLREETMSRFINVFVALTSVAAAGAASAQNTSPLPNQEPDALVRLVNAGMFTDVSACMVRAAQEVYGINVSYAGHQRPTTDPVISYPNVETSDGTFAPTTTLTGQNGKQHMEVVVYSDLSDMSISHTVNVRLVSLKTMARPNYQWYQFETQVSGTVVDLSKIGSLAFAREKGDQLDAVTAITYAKPDLVTGDHGYTGYTVLADGKETGPDYWGPSSNHHHPLEMYRPATPQVRLIDLKFRGCVAGG